MARSKTPPGVVEDRSRCVGRGDGDVDSPVPSRILTFLPRILPRSTTGSIMASMVKP